MKIKQKRIILLFVVLVMSVVYAAKGNITFSTPEKAYSYKYLDECEFVIYGENSAQAVGDRICSVSEENGRWKISKVTTADHMLGSSWGGIYFYQESKERSAYYIHVNFAKEPLTISDTKNSEFVQLYDEERERYSYYAYVSEIDIDYVLSLNGEEHWVLNELNELEEHIDLLKKNN